MQYNQNSLKPDCFYHVYNRAIGNEKLFFSTHNYHYFLLKYQQFISPFAQTYAYCLLPNHFHFLIQIKPLVELETLTGFETLSGLNEEQLSNKLSLKFSHLFNGYAQAINKEQSRKGSLFTRPFKKKQIESAENLKNATIYIHQNAVSAGLSKCLEAWPFSSYNQIVQNELGFVATTEVLEWFEGLKNFKHCHVNNLRA